MVQWPAILEPTRKIYCQPQASQKRYIEYICNIYVYSNVEIAGMKNLQTGMQLLYKSLLHLPPFFVGSLVEDVQKICNNKHGGKKQKTKRDAGCAPGKTKVCPVFGLPCYSLVFLDGKISRSRCGFLGSMTTDGDQR